MSDPQYDDVRADVLSDLGLSGNPNVEDYSLPELQKMLAGDPTGFLRTILVDLWNSLKGEKGDPGPPQTKAGLGLDQVDNTSDLDKPISNATQEALDQKSDIGHTHDSRYIRTVNGTGPDETGNVVVAGGGGGGGTTEPAPDATDTVKGIIRLAGDLSGTALSPTVPGLAGKANTVHTHTKDQVGLSNVDNTSDVNKPISTATQAALDGKISILNGVLTRYYDTGTSTYPARGSEKTSIVVGPKNKAPTDMGVGDFWFRTPEV